MSQGSQSVSAKTAAKHVEKTFDRNTGNGADLATDALVREINENPAAAGAILKKIARDDTAKHDNVLAYIALDYGERQLLGEGVSGTNLTNSDCLTPADLHAIQTNPPAATAGDQAVLKASAHYLDKHYWSIAGRTDDSPANADGSEHEIPMLAQDLTMTMGALYKQPGWNEPPVVQHETLGEKIYYTLNRYF